MKICDGLYHAMAERAAKTTVEVLSVGLGYTAVSTVEGGLGLAYTAFDNKQTCSVISHGHDYEGGPALDLLDLITSRRPIERSMALALINAVNHEVALALPEDRNNSALFDLLGINQGSRVAMVGYFKPVIDRLRALEVEVEVLDVGRNIGDQRVFINKLSHWAEALIMTSTTILNDTADELLAAVPPRVEVALLGPSTPMVAEPFGCLPVRVLAGTVPVNKEATFKAVRHGKGTPVLQRFGRKVYLALQPQSGAN
jgi:hypothetical protein